MHVTHYRAPFAKECAAYGGPAQYPGLPIPQTEFDRLPAETQRLVAKWNKHYDAGVMAGDFLWPLATAARTKLPLYCGEFGVIRNAPPEIRDAWHRDFIGTLEAHGIPWAVWNYKGWGFFDRDGVEDPVLHELLSKT